MTEEAQEPQASNEPNEQETNTPDLSAYFKDGEAGVFDPEKVAGLAKDLENQKKSTSYFQSQFMKKNGVPETAEGYYTHFKADSTYEEALKDEEVKNSVDDFFKWCKDNNINGGVAKFKDYTTKDGVATKQYTFKLSQYTQFGGKDNLDEKALGYGAIINLLASAYDYDNKFGKGTSASLRAVYVKEGATKSALGEISK